MHMKKVRGKNMKLITKEVSNPEKKFWIWDEKITNKQDGRIYLIIQRT